MQGGFCWRCNERNNECWVTSVKVTNDDVCQKKCLAKKFHILTDWHWMAPSAREEKDSDDEGLSCHFR